jgi:hypothetical protein
MCRCAGNKIAIMCNSGAKTRDDYFKPFPAIYSKTAMSRSIDNTLQKIRFLPGVS